MNEPIPTEVESAIARLVGANFLVNRDVKSGRTANEAETAELNSMIGAAKANLEKACKETGFDYQTGLDLADSEFRELKQDPSKWTEKAMHSKSSGGGIQVGSSAGSSIRPASNRRITQGPPNIDDEE